jgi:uncharacterized protein (TIGR00299 family) protein
VSPSAHLDPVGGVSGDMVLAALLDAGAPFPALEVVPVALGLEDVRIRTERVRRGGVTGTLVSIDEPASPAARPATAIRSLVERATLPDHVRERSLRAIDALIDAESAIHDVEPTALVLHELSGVDTLVDVCGAFALLHAMGITDLSCGPLPFGGGTIVSAHGPLPSPGPAVLRIAAGAPWIGVDAPHETVTPTGAAIVATAANAWGPLPAMTVDAVGYGAGQRNVEGKPNVLRVMVGTRDDLAADIPVGDVVLLEANLDDLIPELVPDAMERCMAAGALDVWITPVTMKKGRPGMVMAAIARPQAEHAVAVALFEHTSTLGVRVRTLRRYELERATEVVEVRGHVIRVKLGLLQGRVVNVAPEHDDCAAAAEALGAPVKRIWAEALAAAALLDAVGGDGPAR